MSKKGLLAWGLSKTGVFACAMMIRKRTGGFTRLPILAYHRVMDCNTRTYPFDSDLISASVDAFDRQMDYVKRNFNVITFDALKRALDAGRIPENPLIVTFDDGYRDNYLNAYPILKHHGIPATFFVAVSYIGTKEVFHFERVVYLIKQAGRGDRASLIEEIQARIKRSDPSTVAAIIAQIEGELKVGDYPIAEVAMMTWEDVREMADNGMEIGSHGLRHINMAMTSDLELREETVDSKKRIEKEVGKPIVALAYPFGQADHFDERVKVAVAQAGYSFALAYIHGADVIGNGTRHQFELKRLHVESDVTLDYFKAMLAFPSVF